MEEVGGVGGEGGGREGRGIVSRGRRSPSSERYAEKDIWISVSILYFVVCSVLVCFKAVNKRKQVQKRRNKHILQRHGDIQVHKLRGSCFGVCFRKQILRLKKKKKKVTGDRK